MPDVAEKDSARSQETSAQNKVSAKARESKATTMIIVLLELLSIAFAFIVVNHVLKPRIPEWAIQEDREPVEEKENSAEPGVILTIPDLVVNPAGSHGTRYLSASIGIEVPDEEAKHHVEGRAPAVRDALIGILSAETVEQLSAPEERTYLRKTIMRELNRLLRPVKIRNVYFIDYVLQ